MKPTPMKSSLGAPSLAHLIACGLVFPVASGWAQADPKTLPLLDPSAIRYLGAFALPKGNSGTSSFTYGGSGLTPYKDPATGKRTLFLVGHSHKPGHVAQIEVPETFVKSVKHADLPMAKVLQPFADLVEGNLPAKAGITTSDGGPVNGLLVYNNRLITTVSEWYGCTQQRSHGVSKLDLSASGDFQGFYALQATAPTRSLGGPMTLIPPEWRTLLGGSALTGNWAFPVVSCNSAGPSVTVFNPDDIGSQNPAPGQTLLQYPLSNTLCIGSTCLNPSPDTTQNEAFNMTTKYGGVAFPSGSRSVLFFGSMGIGKFCYGTAAECNDPTRGDEKGPHAYPYRYQIWAYDANDLLAVKSNLKKTYEPKPYGIWPINDLSGILPTGDANITSAGYDPETRRWYVTVDYEENPRVEVFEIMGANVTTRPTQNIKRINGIKSYAIGHKTLALSIPDLKTQELHGNMVRYQVFNPSGHLLATVESRAENAKAIVSLQNHGALEVIILAKVGDLEFKSLATVF